MFIALTALRDFWSADASQEMRYLGPWCLFPDHLSIWEKERARIIPSPWDDRTAFHQASRYIDDLAKRWSDELADFLNRALGTSFSKRYWRIICGYWLVLFLGQSYDRYVCLANALSRFPGAEGLLLDVTTPLDLRALARDTALHVRELDRFSRIAAHLRWNVPSRPLPQPASRSVIPEATEPQENPAVRRMGEIFVGWLTYDYSAVASIANRTGARVALYDKRLDAIPDEHSADVRLRNAAFVFSARNEYERIAGALIKHYFPARYFEGFLDYRDCVLRRFDSLPKLAVSGLGFQESDVFKFIAAETSASGGRLVGAQHSPIHGLYRDLPARRFELDVSDSYWCWGWADSRNRKLKNMPSLFASLYTSNAMRQQKRTSNETIALVANQFEPYLLDFRSGVRGHGGIAYLDWQIRFLQALPERLRKRTTLRFKRIDQYRVFEPVRLQFPEVCLSSQEQSLATLLEHSRLAVSDCPTQAYVDCLLTTPTILFWDRNLWNMNRGGERAFSGLARAGVFFDTPEAAASQVVAQYADPWAWWESNAVRFEVRSFVDAYTAQSDKWCEIWACELEKELGSAGAPIA